MTQQEAHIKQQSDYQKYIEYCESLGKKPRTWYEWTYCTYSAFEESWRLKH